MLRLYALRMGALVRRPAGRLYASRIVTFPEALSFREGCYSKLSRISQNRRSSSKVCEDAGVKLIH
jgi:hypothetical protein